ncbi:PREDICTED: uncharacterized protein At2g34160-like [Brassica oleracea var. oleracea]|uniref:uncharacterized protein At2g34160-like n=1 Tax=Brassica oleracea var. oleracea TaxID=109376 RepID=UPI0006A748DA|nr:PREDICTED: uncharacterized protein At2g34160-like [Brassica oleracea var. oleracea]
MEEITDGVNNMNLAVDSQKKNRIQVSNTKKPLFFYVNLAKDLSRWNQMVNHFGLPGSKTFAEQVEILSQSLKNYVKIEITLGKSEKFDELMTAANEEKEEQQKLRYKAEHSLLLISDAFVFTHPQTQVVSPPLFSSHSHTLSRCRTFSFHLSG